MATTRLMTTVLPYSVDPADPFHVSLFFSHRLEGGGTLADYPVMLNWVKALRDATVRLRTDVSATPIACTPLLIPTGDDRVVVPSETAWETAFPATTAVADYRRAVEQLPRAPDSRPRAGSALRIDVLMPGEPAGRGRQSPRRGTARRVR